jgi:hypothetical protein
MQIFIVYPSLPRFTNLFLLHLRLTVCMTQYLLLASYMSCPSHTLYAIQRRIKYEYHVSKSSPASTLFPLFHISVNEQKCRSEKEVNVGRRLPFVTCTAWAYCKNSTSQNLTGLQKQIANSRQKEGKHLQAVATGDKVGQTLRGVRY